MAVQVGGGLTVGSLLQDLGQASGRIQHILGGHAIHALGHAVARAVVGEPSGQGAAHDLHQPVGVVVTVAAQAVVQQACPEPVEGLPLSSQVYTTPLTDVKRLAAS